MPTATVPSRIFKCLSGLALIFAFSCRADDVMRTWTNTQGMSRDAALVSVEEGHVTLIMTNGKLLLMDLDKLSQADQDYIHAWQQRMLHNPAAGAPAADQTPASVASPTPTPMPDLPPSPAPALQPRGPTPQPVDLLQAKLSQTKGLPDPRVQPKAELLFKFPELGLSRTGDEPMTMSVRIPENYRPDRPVPLIVWLAGGDGNFVFNEALSLVNKEDFVLVGMNYPRAVPLPMKVAPAGQIDLVWEYHQRMLVKLLDTVPNIDPRLRVIVGFSNGAHTIGGCLSQGVKSLYNFFNVYVLIEGGESNSYIYPPLPGRYYYVAWGAGEGGRGDTFGTTLAQAARKAQMNVEAHSMTDIGHAFPAFEEQKVKAWLYNVVIPARLGNQ